MIRIRLFGEVSMRVGRVRVLPGSAVQFALTLYLATTAGVPVARARLIDLFWSHMDDEGARHALRQMLYRLRRAGLALEESGERLLVSRDAVEADFLAAFEPSWGERATHAELAGAAHFLEDTALLALPDFRDWVDDLRARVAAVARRVILERIAQARREGRWTRVEDWARLCLVIDPLNEQATLARAEAQAMSGAKSSAMRTLDAYVEDLGDAGHDIALPARVLRERIAENFTTIRNVPEAWRRYVGRSGELARCHAVIDEAVSGTGATVLVSGASGIGKTRFAQEMLSVAQLRGLQTTSMRLEARDRERALALFTEIVPALLQLPGAAACAPESMRTLTQFTRTEDAERTAQLAADAPVIRERIRRSIVDVIGAVSDEAPLVVLVDDAHNLDRASLAMLRTLMETAEGRRVVWLMCGDGLDRQPWVPTLPGVPVSLRLGGLTQEECAALASVFLPESGVADAPSVLATCFAATRGNPMFVKEWMRAWQANGAIPSVPDPIREALQKRVRLLSPEGLHALHACCLLGPLATPATLGELLEMDVSAALRAVEELDAADLLASQPSNPLEIHELTAQVVREMMSAAHTRVLHYRIGQCLESRAVSSWSPRIAWAAAAHLHAAGEEERAVGLLRQCGRHLLMLGEIGDACLTFERGLQLSSTVDNRGQAFVDWAQALLYAGQLRRSAEVSAQALHELRDVGCEHSTVRDLRLLQLTADWPRSADLAHPMARAETLMQEPGTSRAHAARFARLAMVIAGNAHDNSAILRISRAIKARFIDDSCSELLDILAISASALGDNLRAIAYLERQIRLEREGMTVQPLARSLVNISIPLRALGRSTQALARLQEAYDLAANHGIAAEAATASDRISAIAFDHRQARQCEGWIRLAQSWAGKTDDCMLIRSVTHQAIRVDAHFGLLGLSEGDVSAFLEGTRSELSAVRAVEELAASLMWRCAKQSPLVSSLTEEMLGRLSSLRSDERSDYSVAAVATGLLFRNEPALAAALLAEHSRDRSASSEEPWYLTTARRGDVRALFDHSKTALEAAPQPESVPGGN